MQLYQQLGFPGIYKCLSVLIFLNSFTYSLSLDTKFLILESNFKYISNIISSMNDMRFEIKNVRTIGNQLD